MRSRVGLFFVFLLTVAAAWAQGEPAYLLKGVKVVVAPGRTIERTDVLLQNGVIAKIGANLTAPAGAETIDGTGLTAYPGFIHPYLKVSVEGVVPTTTGLTPVQIMAGRDEDPFNQKYNRISQIRLGHLVQSEISALSSLARAGYGLANTFVSGGIIGSQGDVVSLAAGGLGPASLVAPRRGVALNLSGRGFAGYPNSQMGVIAFIRQTMIDAGRYAREKAAWEANPAGRPRHKSDPSFDGLVDVVRGDDHPYIDDLNEVQAYQAMNIAKEFNLKPVYTFRQQSGWLKEKLKSAAAVLLRGEMANRPTLGADDARNSLIGVRNYFNELQAAAELEAARIEFQFAPSSTTDPLSALRTYTRAGLSRDAALAAITTRPAKLLNVEKLAGTLEEGKLGNLVLMQGDLFDSSSQLMAVFVEGKKLTGALPSLKKAEDLKANEPFKLMPPKYEPFPRPAETAAMHKIYKSATIWTMGKQGVLLNADILIRDGKIVGIGKDLPTPRGAVTIDATGKHISPGIWDCHSHTAIDGSVNEGSNMVTVECRIADVINHRNSGIYRQLGGGTVGAQQLHGSANVIGGQSSPVKWRWGLDPTQFPIAGAPGGVKFALGQNPIREDSGGFGGQQQPDGKHLLTWRPRTRMGNEESIRRALNAGLDYAKQWEDFRSGKATEEPRRDLLLEGMMEIVTGKRLVHSHGYRADEMLMLLRVVKEAGGRIATLQHVLEGYKIADEMAAQGVGGSTFADWWGYKLEAYDAIPHNAALMADRGVSVSVNSDSDNHARRLNLEAAKSMRYGGVSPEKALSFVTIEPARQMGIDKFTGSLEIGKDADFVVWTAEPTSVFAICLETYVDGVKRFDLDDDAKQRAARLEELAEAKKVLEARPAAPTAEANNSADDGPAAIKGMRTLTGRPGNARYPRRPLHIVGATVHPMSGEPFVGDVLIGADGLIVGTGKVSAPRDAVRVDGKGKHVYPGIIDGSTTLGLTEIGQVPASDDSSEKGDFHPDYRAIRALNPDSELIAAARNQGVLTALTAPAGAGFAGQAALLSLDGYTFEDLAIEGSLAIKIRLGGAGFSFGEDEDCCGDQVDFIHALFHEHDEELTAGQGRRGGGGGVAADAMLTRITTELGKAREYRKNRDAGMANQGPFVAKDDRYEALLAATTGDLPFLFEAHTAADIKAAVAWAEKEKVAIQIVGASSAGEIAEWLATKQVPILLTATLSMPGAEDPLDQFYSLAGRLHKAGVKFAIATNESHDVRLIRDIAGFAARHGLPAEDAARAITLWPAEILGVGKRLGAIAPGYEGTVILTDGPLVEFKTQVLKAWIMGRECDLSFRQTRLYDKYNGRPKVG